MHGRLGDLKMTAKNFHDRPICFAFPGGRPDTNEEAAACLLLDAFNPGPGPGLNRHSHGAGLFELDPIP